MIDLDCKKCGACCRVFSLVQVEDNHRIPLNLVDSDNGQLRMKTTATARCVCFGDDGLCQIYESRPRVCREFEIGGQLCLRAIEAHKQGRTIP